MESLAGGDARSTQRPSDHNLGIQTETAKLLVPINPSLLSPPWALPVAWVWGGGSLSAVAPVASAATVATSATSATSDCRYEPSSWEQPLICRLADAQGCHDRMSRRFTLAVARPQDTYSNMHGLGWRLLEYSQECWPLSAGHLQSVCPNAQLTCQTDFMLVIPS